MKGKNLPRVGYGYFLEAHIAGHQHIQLALVLNNFAFGHSCPHRPQSFWSAPRMVTSDLSQFLSMRRVFVLQFSANKIRQI